MATALLVGRLPGHHDTYRMPSHNCTPGRVVTMILDALLHPDLLELTLIASTSCACPRYRHILPEFVDVSKGDQQEDEDAQDSTSYMYMYDALRVSSKITFLGRGGEGELRGWSGPVGVFRMLRAPRSGSKPLRKFIKLKCPKKPPGNV